MNVSFGSTTPIIAKPGSLSALKAQLAYEVEKSQPYGLLDLTHLFKGATGEDVLVKAAAEGNEVGLLVTGSEYKKMAEKAQGWESEAEAVKHADRLPVIIKKHFNTVLDKLIIRITTDK